jgi:cholesterol oxidase
MSPADDHFDAVVIGSGFGGSVVAYRLAEQGRSVLILERGQPHPPGTFPRSPHALRGSFWDPSAGLYGMFDVWTFDHLDAVVASGLGGGSLIYANVMLRKDEATFVQEHPSGGGESEPWPVTRAQLEGHYDAVARMQRPESFPLEQGGPYGEARKTRAMLEAGAALGLEATLPPLAIAFAAGAGQPAVPGVQFSDGHDNLHGVARSTCRLCGECDLGCNYGAKHTLDFTYLSAAMRHGAAIRTCCTARTIEPLDGRRGGYRVGYRQHLGARDGHPDHLLAPTRDLGGTVTAGEVVIAAGAVATPHLLLSNRAALPGLSPALGTRVSGNGDYLAWVRDCKLRDGSDRWRYLDPSYGPVITASLAVDARRSRCGREFLIQDAGSPVFGDWLWQATEMPGDLLGEARALLGRRLARLWGRRRRTNASELAARALGDAHASAAMLPLLGMGRDIPNGRYRLDGDELTLDWSLEATAGYYDAMRAGMRELAGVLGGKFIREPLDRSGRSISVHMVGGCPMDPNPRLGVVDSYGRVHGHRGLWVADGSVMPGPVGVNPSFTIAALADRFADAMLDPALAR